MTQVLRTHLIDSEKPLEKDDIKFTNFAFPYIFGNIPAAPVYNIFLSWNDIPEFVVPIKISW
jgi:hypothetical protein